MPNLILRFHPDAETDPQLLADQLQQKLITLSDVTDVRTDVPNAQLHETPAVKGSVTILPTAMESIDKVVAGLKHAAESTKGVHEAFAEIGERRIALADLTAKDLESTVSGASAG